MSSIVEQQYQSRMDSLLPKQRVARSQAMFRWTREMIGRQILRESGTMSPERLKWEIALRQYGSDPITRAMIERELKNVPG
ncbi:MAG: hypothetical protein H8E66_26790 [Planctomycetes bacterium]|nr:hypothetical protein [Planctomycetota bacterium]